MAIVIHGLWNVGQASMGDWQYYVRIGGLYARPWQPGDDMSRISVSQADRDAGSPKEGDMIASNPNNPDDQWLIAAAYFRDHYARPSE